LSHQPYDELAGIYDHFQRHLDPTEWASYLHRLYLRTERTHTCQGEDGKPLLVELGCGTGRMLAALADVGFDVIGIDASPGMLQAARETFAEKKATPLLLLQDISDFELFGTVDCVVCLLDTVNHLTSEEAVRRCFARTANYLHPGGVFIFDLATPEHFRETLGNRQFFEVTETYALLWQNEYHPKCQESRSELTLFEQLPDGLYRRSETCIVERSYTPDQMTAWLIEAGFEGIESFADRSERPSTAGEERIFFAARSGKKGFS
jgi:SAM-dependent methyltransferase